MDDWTYNPLFPEYWYRCPSWLQYLQRGSRNGLNYNIGIEWGIHYAEKNLDRAMDIWAARAGWTEYVLPDYESVEGVI